MSSHRRLLLDPPSEVNLNLPNLALAFAATRLGARVVDLHALPWPASRLLRESADELVISARPYSAHAAQEARRRWLERFPSSLVRSLGYPGAPLPLGSVP